MAARDDPLAVLNDELRQKGLASQTSEWLALESNPEIFDKFGQRVGLPSGWGFVDVLILEEEYLASIPGEVAAVILLFPCTDRIYGARRAQSAALHSGREGANGERASPEDLFFVRQVAGFGNACGTIACLHALSNSRHLLGGMAADAPLESFVKEQPDSATPEQRGAALLVDPRLKEPSDTAASDTVAQTRCPARDGPPLDHHFAAFVRTPGNRLVELDGTKATPVDHGATTSGTFLIAAAKAIQKNFIAVDPDVHGFVLMALVKHS